jgi:hypothetical protein
MAGREVLPAIGNYATRSVLWILSVITCAHIPARSYDWWTALVATSPSLPSVGKWN